MPDCTVGSDNRVGCGSTRLGPAPSEGAATAGTASLVRYDPAAVTRTVALVGFLADYGGRTREPCGLNLRQFFAWGTERQAISE